MDGTTDARIEGVSWPPFNASTMTPTPTPTPPPKILVAPNYGIYNKIYTSDNVLSSDVLLAGRMPVLLAGH